MMITLLMVVSILIMILLRILILSLLHLVINISIVLSLVSDRLLIIIYEYFGLLFLKFSLLSNRWTCRYSSVRRSNYISGCRLIHIKYLGFQTVWTLILIIQTQLTILFLITNFYIFQLLISSLKLRIEFLIYLNWSLIHCTLPAVSFDI